MPCQAASSAAPLLLDRLDAAAVAGGRGAPRDELLDRHPHLVELAHRLHARRARRQPAARVAHDVPVALQAAQRLAHRRAARLELGGQLLLDEPPADRQVAAQQALAQPGVDALGLRDPARAVALPPMAAAQLDRSSSATAATKASNGGSVTPPPICPTPGSRCAMPVWIGGTMPVAHDRARVDAEDRRAVGQRQRRVLARRDRAKRGHPLADRLDRSSPTDGADSGDAPIASAPSP